MFSLFVNELAVELAKKGKHGIQIIPNAVEIFLLLFADDIILLSDTVSGLQNQLSVLKEEADRLGLTVNLDKTDIMVFRMGGHLSIWERWFYGNDEVKVVNSYKYLGLSFTTKLSLNLTWMEICRKGKKGVLEILKTLRKLNCIDCNILFRIFDSQIEPLLTYGAEIWGLSRNLQMERVHTFAIKRFLSIPVHASNKIIYGETGRYPLYVKSYTKCIRYWLKLVKLPQTRLCKQAYDMMLTQMELGYENWSSSVNNVLSENGFGVVWMCQGVGHDKQFISEFKTRLVDNFKQNWHSDMENKEKYSWFYSFKSMFQVEKFLGVITNKWHRSNYARFRLRTFGFNANKRWFQPGTSTEIPCPLCDYSVDNEIHFVFDCKALEKVRSRCEVFGKDAALRKDLISLLSSEDDDTIISVAKYISEAWSIRRKTVLSDRLVH
eukprot:TRINITY_DN5549_c0_g1_i12.p1 TRINITY_DN5549_c0_g1~~TRINITY_DN5549_c0_g1_i12.p1  ORF type:complete len:436 (-),score=19.73 TRINITY_DN5549_c0_g1_i12:134-1441(-)